MRPVRQGRYDKLRRSGFLDFEAREFSGDKDVWKSPAFQKYVIERRAAFLSARNEAKKKGVELNTKSRVYERYANKIKEKYDKNSWKKTKGQGIASDPWQFFHASEGKFNKQMKTQGKDYVSPHIKRNKVWINDVKKMEKRYQLGMFD